MSPLLFALNTLVAEFLYAQNCHFTLSVFATECPFKHAMPPFERTKRFRFTSTELDEIGEAVGLKTQDAARVNAYYVQDNSNVNDSLLFALCHTLFGGLLMSVPTLPPSYPPPPRSTQTEFGRKKTKSKEVQTIESAAIRRPHTISDEQQQKYLQKFNNIMDRMSEHILKMTANMEALKSRKWFGSVASASQQNSKQFERLNEGLDKITQALQQLVDAEKSPQQLTLMVATVTKLTVEMQRCAESFDKLLSLARVAAAAIAEKVDVPVETDQKYSQWVDTMCHSKFGRRFLRRVDEHHRKQRKRENAQLKQEYDARLAEAKKLIKSKLKDKVTRKCRLIMSTGLGTVEASDRDDGKIKYNGKIIQLRTKGAGKVVPPPPPANDDDDEARPKQKLTRVTGVPVDIVPVVVDDGCPTMVTKKSVMTMTTTTTAASPLEKVPAPSREPIIVEHIVKKTK